MIAEYYDDTKSLKLFIRFFHFFDCSNQMSITSVRNKIFWFCKKKSKTTSDGFWAPVSHKQKCKKL